MKNWELTDTDFYDDNYEEYEYARKVMWKNHEIKIILFCNNENKVSEEEIEEIVDKIMKNKDYWDKKCKNLFTDKFVDWFNEEKWIKPEYSEIYYENKDISDVEKKLIEIIGKEDTEKIMKNNFLTKEAFKKLLDNEDMVIRIDLNDGDKDTFVIAMHERLFFVDKMFYAYCNFNGEIDEFYMD